MTIVVQLNLPSPSLHLVSHLSNIIKETNLDISGKYWLDEQQQINNSAEHLFFARESFDVLVQEEYAKVFNRPVGGLIGVMRNNGKTQYAVQPPHIDRGRALAINYYVELGGDNITTTFYDCVEDSSPTESKNFTYSEINNKKLGSVIFSNRHWYAFDVCRCHSIENIQTTRYFFSIYFKDYPPHLYRLSNFQQEYPLLIGNSLKLV